jgi:hypothetical protein
LFPSVASPAARYNYNTNSHARRILTIAQVVGDLWEKYMDLLTTEMEEG